MDNLKILIKVIENKYLSLSRDKQNYDTTYCELNDIEIKQHLLEELVDKYVTIIEGSGGFNPEIWEDTEK